MKVPGSDFPMPSASVLIFHYSRLPGNSSRISRKKMGINILLKNGEWAVRSQGGGEIYKVYSDN